MDADSNREHAAVLITGASRGLGLGLACVLASQKVPVVVTARNGRSLARVAATLAHHAPVVAVEADAADPAAMHEALQAARRLGPLQGLVNNAGLLEPIGPIDQIDLGAFEAALRTNITGVLVGMRMALCHLPRGPALRILNVSSGAATHPYAGWAAYCASKAAVGMLTSVAATEQSTRSDLSIIAVAPGVIETAMQRAIRNAPPEAFPEQHKFVQLKLSGALLHPVHAAVALDWLVRFSPLAWSGRTLDARSDEVLVPAREHGASLGACIAQAIQWFEQLEP